MSKESRAERIEVIQDFLSHLFAQTEWQIRHAERINAHVLKTWLQRHMEGLKELQDMSSESLLAARKETSHDQ
jgi:hypothetical protein